MLERRVQAAGAAGFLPLAGDLFRDGAAAASTPFRLGNPVRILRYWRPRLSLDRPATLRRMALGT